MNDVEMIKQQAGQTTSRHTLAIKVLQEAADDEWNAGLDDNATALRAAADALEAEPALQAEIARLREMLADIPQESQNCHTESMREINRQVERAIAHPDFSERTHRAWRAFMEAMPESISPTGILASIALATVITERGMTTVTARDSGYPTTYHRNAIRAILDVAIAKVRRLMDE